MKKLIVIAFGLFAVFAAKSQTTEVTITVTNVTSNDGVVKVCLFNNANAFPSKPEFAVKCVSVKATKGTMQIKVEGVQPGEYAIAVHHDKNNDGKMNTNFFGIPNEPAGASNGAKASMGPPKYKDAAVRIDKNTKQLSITLN